MSAKAITIVTAIILFFSNAFATMAAENLPMPTAESDSYDPTLTAKEAALTSYALAVSGIGAGKVVSDRLLTAQSKDLNFEDLAEQARFAVKTMLVRYNSADWLISTHDQIPAVDAATLLAAVEASQLRCEAGDCDAQLEAIQIAFKEAAQAFEKTSEGAKATSEKLEAYSDRALMAEVLSTMANYLQGTGWYSPLALTAVGRDGEEVSARIVGTLAIWNTIEPYVGLVNAEVDNAVNQSISRLLRDMRRHTRKKTVLDPNGKEIGAIGKSSKALAADLRKAAALFKD